MDKISWKYLSANKNPKAIQLLEKHPEQIFWPWFSENPSAINILTPYDFVKMKEKNVDFFYELCKKVFNPQRIQRIASVYDLDLDEYLDRL